MVFSGIMLLAAATAHGDWAHVTFTTRGLVAVAYLTIAGSLIAYSAYIYAIQHLPLSLVSVYAYINPVIAVALGTVFLSEPFTTRIAAAAVLVLVGTWIVGKR
jgi:drug/metabolite transporter (DMT)-like permease